MSTGLAATFTRRFPGGPRISVESLTADRATGVTILFGASGSGKTTLLRCIAGLDLPDEGRIEFNGRVWFDAARRQVLPPEQRRIGFVPQDGLLFPHLTVAENIGYGLCRTRGVERRACVEKMMDRFGLDGLERRLPHELSGGQQQRVALARAVARSPQLLLLDEPLSALDAPTRHRMRGELRRWLEKLSIPTLLVTHDAGEALALGRRMVVLNQGRIEQEGTVSEVFNHPANLSVARIAGVDTVAMGRIVNRSEGLAEVAVGGVRFHALAGDLEDDVDDVHVCIRAEDVALMRDAGAIGSVRNRIAATVVSVQAGLPLARVELDCGFPMKALITRQAIEELNLLPGASVTACIKAPHVHLIAG
jgi:molybdate transport system ATP-binding protein